MRPPTRVAPALAVGALLALAGCGGTTDAGGSDRELTVLAAASLTESFSELAATFERQHPGVDVRLAFDSSATLALQVVEGAPADVLATADTTTMDQVVTADAAAAEPRLFATNTLVLVTPADNPAGIEALDDLDRRDVTYVACVESAPCGALARELLDRNDVAADPRSLEVDVKAVLAKVALDEADAGLVYATDAEAAGDDVRRLEVPGAADSPNPYLAVPVAQARHPDLARDWVDLLLSAEGQRVLADAGFGPAGP